MSQVGCVESHHGEESVIEVNIIGLDLARNVFQAHGVNASSVPAFSKQLRRDQILAYFAIQLPAS